MRYFISSLVGIAWALWFGGVIALFMFINRLFESMHAEYRTVFDIVAPQQFTMWERFEMVIGGFALLAAFTQQVLAPSRASTWLFALLAVAGAIALSKPLFISGRMLALIQPGMTPTPEFKKLHGLYMAMGSVEAIFLLMAGFTLPAALGGKPKSKTSAE